MSFVWVPVGHSISGVSLTCGTPGPFGPAETSLLQCGSPGSGVSLTQLWSLQAAVPHGIERFHVLKELANHKASLED